MAAKAQTSLNRPFEECHIRGSITIYDYKARKWITNDIKDSHYPTLPASTFKIVNTLIVLETGAVADEHEIVPWPGTTDTARYGVRPDIYHDMDVAEAFKRSAGWVYRELARKVGKERYRDYLTRLQYGNADLSTPDPDFWNYGPFAVSPVNQLEVLVGIYEERYPFFSKKAYAALKRLMIAEQQEAYTIRAKTGWTLEGGKDTGWWVGYVETKDNVYFFATRIIKDRTTVNRDFSKCRMIITRKVLRQLGILPSS